MKKFCILLCLIWMSFIFYMSSQNSTESNNNSYSILNAVKQEYRIGKELIHNDQNNETVGKSDSSVKASKDITASVKAKSSALRDRKLNIFIRKNAHIFMYLVLAVLISNALFIYKCRGKFALVYIMFPCLLYAVLDEFHQSFTRGRSALVSDVLIDFSGSLIGMVLFYLVYYKISRKKAKKSLE